MRLFGRKQEVAGYVAAYDLSKWWLKAFSEAEREAMTSKYQPMGLSFRRPLTEGEMTRHGSTRSFLTTLAGWFNTPSQRPLAKAIMLKAIETDDGDTVDDHFLYSELIPIFYPDRETDPDALNRVIWACECQIAISGKAAKEFLRRGLVHKNGTLPSHRGYEQLAIIREKQGRLDDAIKLARNAKKAGWAGDWDKRIQRLEGKKAKNK